MNRYVNRIPLTHWLIGLVCCVLTSMGHTNNVELSVEGARLFAKATHETYLVPHSLNFKLLVKTSSDTAKQSEAMNEEIRMQLLGNAPIGSIDVIQASEAVTDSAQRFLRSNGKPSTTSNYDILVMDQAGLQHITQVIRDQPDVQLQQVIANHDEKETFKKSALSEVINSAIKAASNYGKEQNLRIVPLGINESTAEFAEYDLSQIIQNLINEPNDDFPEGLSAVAMPLNVKATLVFRTD